MARLINKVREKQIEQGVCELAGAAGWCSWKLGTHGSQGLPDRMFVRTGRIVFVEFKSPKGVVSRVQQDVARQLRENGMKVCFVSSVEAGITALR